MTYSGVRDSRNGSGWCCKDEKRGLAPFPNGACPRFHPNGCMEGKVKPIEFDAIIFQEGKAYVAYCPELDVLVAATT